LSGGEDGLLRTRRPTSWTEGVRGSSGDAASAGRGTASSPANSRTKLAHRGQHDAGSGFGGEVRTFQTSPHLAHLNRKTKRWPTLSSVTCGPATDRSAAPLVITLARVLDLTLSPARRTGDAQTKVADGRWPAPHRASG
jgi:hypothetical protein